MKRKWIILILAAITLLAGCAAQQSLQSSHQRKISRRALEKAKSHYLTAALYDFQDQYERALIEYFQALTFDSTSAQIHKAIGRDFLRTQRFESAIPYLQKAVRLNPNDKEALYYLAEAYYNTKNYALAIRYFEKFFAIDPYNRAVLNNLEYLYTQTRDTTRLVSLLEKEVELFGYEEDLILKLYSIYLERKDYQRAQRLVQQLVQQEPENPTNYVLLGNLYELQQDTTQALLAYQKALELNPRSQETLLRLYRMYRQAHQWDLLIQVLSKLLEQDPTDTRKALMLSEAYLFTQQFNKVDSLLQPFREDPTFKEQVYELLARAAVGAQQLDRAETYLRTLVQINPKSKFGWVYLALLYNQQKNFSESLRSLQLALTYFKDDPVLLNLYGSTLIQVKRYDDALKVLEKAHALEPEDRDIIVSLGIVYDHLKMYPQLDSLYQSALIKYPDDPLLLNNYAYSLAERGVQLEDALQMAKHALSKDSTNGAYLDTVGWIYYKLGDYQTALEFLLQAVKNREESAEVLQHVGEVYLKLGDLDNARKYFQRALQLEPENPVIRQKLQQL